MFTRSHSKTLTGPGSGAPRRRDVLVYAVSDLDQDPGEDGVESVPGSNSREPDGGGDDGDRYVKVDKSRKFYDGLYHGGSYSDSDSEREQEDEPEEEDRLSAASDIYHERYGSRFDHGNGNGSLEEADEPHDESDQHNDDQSGVEDDTRTPAVFGVKRNWAYQSPDHVTSGYPVGKSEYEPTELDGDAEQNRLADTALRAVIGLMPKDLKVVKDGVKDVKEEVRDVKEELTEIKNLLCGLIKQYDGRSPASQDALNVSRASPASSTSGARNSDEDMPVISVSRELSPTRALGGDDKEHHKPKKQEQRHHSPGGPTEKHEAHTNAQIPAVENSPAASPTYMKPQAKLRSRMVRFPVKPQPQHVVLAQGQNKLHGAEASEGILDAMGTDVDIGQSGQGVREATPEALTNRLTEFELQIPGDQTDQYVDVVVAAYNNFGRGETETKKPHFVSGQMVVSQAVPDHIIEDTSTAISDDLAQKAGNQSHSDPEFEPGGDSITSTSPNTDNVIGNDKPSATPTLKTSEKPAPAVHHDKSKHAVSSESSSDVGVAVASVSSSKVKQRVQKLEQECHEQND